ncbi:hypothetical protein [Paenibacillus sp. 481]|uniref:hypothetical protein n=1 Tax=Paenibacillus sp. 481 TaxID=2835869 RepID=UPI001E5701BE|nr:hypothetical protein [Paenibacillus sp. 481]UHA74070.1 hypothetical protein KIK04_02660 [Paenibacillus sp. 481]
MYKRCTCGHFMDLTLRTVVHARKIEILRVPIFTCTGCERTELLSSIKQDLQEMIKAHTCDAQTRVSISFDAVHELGSVLVECLEQQEEDMAQVLEQAIQARVNQLLDLYLLARTWQDEKWMNDLQLRLTQISGFSLEPYRVKIS